MKNKNNRRGHRRERYWPEVLVFVAGWDGASATAETVADNSGLFAASNPPTTATPQVRASQMLARLRRWGYLRVCAFDAKNPGRPRIVYQLTKKGKQCLEWLKKGGKRS